MLLPCHPYSSYSVINEIGTTRVTVMTAPSTCAAYNNGMQLLCTRRAYKHQLRRKRQKLLIITDKDKALPT